MWVVCRFIVDDDGNDTFLVQSVCTTIERARLHLVDPDVIAVELVPDTDYSEAHEFNVLAFGADEPALTPSPDFSPVLH